MSRAFAHAALALAGAVAAWAAAPVGSAWTADPDEQFLLDVNIRQLRLAMACAPFRPEGTCVVFGDFLTALDLPMKIDLESKRASGWAFKEEHKIDIDLSAGIARFADGEEKLADGIVRETPEGWCVDAAALSRWFNLGVKASTGGSLLNSRVRKQASRRTGDRARKARGADQTGFNAAGWPSAGSTALSPVAGARPRLRGQCRRHL
jgi:hypothetical protein